MFKARCVLLLSCLSLAVAGGVCGARAAGPAHQCSLQLAQRGSLYRRARHDGSRHRRRAQCLLHGHGGRGRLGKRLRITVTAGRTFPTRTSRATISAPWRSHPKIIYVGTGDSAPRNTVLTGEGMYKSTDGGKTWTFIGLGETHIISWILIDPSNPDVVYVAALGHLFGPNPDRGVFKTADGGKTGREILYVNHVTVRSAWRWIRPIRKVVYAAMWQMSRSHWTFSSGGPGSGIYKTTDEGQTGRTSRTAQGCRPASSGRWASRWRRASPMLCTL